MIPYACSFHVLCMTLCIQTCSMNSKVPAMPTGPSHILLQSVSMPEVGRACGHVRATRVHGMCPIHAPFHPGSNFAMRQEVPCHGRHEFVACMFSICNAMAHNTHHHRFLCAAMPHGGMYSPHQLNQRIVVLVIWAHFDGNEAGRATTPCWLGRCRFLFAGAYFCVPLVSSSSA